VSAIETGQGRKFAEGLIKQLTGSDRIKARFLFKEYFEFLPAFKIFLAFNHKPEIHGTDTAIWERVKLVPFEVFIPPEQRDKSLKEKLQKELPGILAWAVKGCLDWHTHGLQEPPEVQQATANYRAEMDVLGRFIQEACLTDHIMRTKSTVLWEAFRAWCLEMGEDCKTQTWFGRELEYRGFRRYADGHNVKWRLGIGLSETP